MVQAGHPCFVSLSSVHLWNAIFHHHEPTSYRIPDAAQLPFSSSASIGGALGPGSAQVPCLSSIFTRALRGTHHRMWPHQNSQVEHPMLRVTPSPLGRAPSSCTPRPNLDRAHHSRARHHLCERRAARFVDSGIAACRPLETVHFPSPNSSSPHPLALASAPIIGKLAKARLLALGPPQAMPVCLLPIDPQAIDSAAVGPFATETPALLSDPRPSLCRTDDLSHGSLPGGSRCSHMRARELQLRCSRSPVSLVHQPRATRPSPHISTSQFSEMLVHPHGPPLGLHVWRDRQCFRHAARPMRQTANVIVAASHPQITERLHPPF